MSNCVDFEAHLSLLLSGRCVGIVRARPWWNCIVPGQNLAGRLKAM